VALELVRGRAQVVERRRRRVEAALEQRAQRVTRVGRHVARARRVRRGAAQARARGGELGVGGSGGGARRRGVGEGAGDAALGAREPRGLRGGLTAKACVREDGGGLGMALQNGDGARQ
jgi:hypothetical protein